MERRDHLMHQIDQLGLVLQRLLAELTGARGPIAAAEGTMDQLNAALGAVITDVDRDPQEMLDALTSDPALTLTNAELLADLFWNLAEASEDPYHARKLRTRAVAILEHLNTTDTTYSLERHGKVAAWRNQL